jgi:DNA-binding MarR family transcriptional regulator
MAADELKTPNLQPITDLDALVHQPSRLMILAVLYVVERADFLFLMTHTGLTRGNLSSHLSKLEDAGYVEIEKEFVDKIPRTLIRMSEVGREAFEAYRTTMLQVLNGLSE